MPASGWKKNLEEGWRGAVRGVTDLVEGEELGPRGTGGSGTMGASAFTVGKLLDNEYG